MLIDDDIRALILKNVDSNTIKKAAIVKGMSSLRDDGVRKVLDSTTTYAEVLRVTQADTL
jgi:general secretion pathway protein E